MLWAETLEAQAEILLRTLRLIVTQLWREHVLPTKQETHDEERKEPGLWAEY